jgi:hypothetical protein
LVKQCHHSIQRPVVAAGQQRRPTHQGLVDQKMPDDL